MVLSVLLLAGTTVASLALPYFLPPPQAEAKPAQKPTVTTYTSQNTGRKILVNTSNSRVQYPKPKPQSLDPSGAKKIGVIVLAIIVFIVLMLVLKR